MFHQKRNDSALQSRQCGFKNNDKKAHPSHYNRTHSLSVYLSLCHYPLSHYHLSHFISRPPNSCLRSPRIVIETGENALFRNFCAAFPFSAAAGSEQPGRVQLFVSLRPRLPTTLLFSLRGPCFLTKMVFLTKVVVQVCKRILFR